MITSYGRVSSFLDGVKLAWQREGDCGDALCGATVRQGVAGFKSTQQDTAKFPQGTVPGRVFEPLRHLTFWWLQGIPAPFTLLLGGDCLIYIATENSGGDRVAGGMSRMAKQEFLATIRDRYQASYRKDKSRILDEFISVTGHHRKHGIGLLAQSEDGSGKAGAASGRRIRIASMQRLLIGGDCLKQKVIDRWPERRTATRRTIWAG